MLESRRKIMYVKLRFEKYNKTQIKLLELKAKMLEMTNALDGNIKIDSADKKNNELYVRTSNVQIETREESKQISLATT